MFTFETDCTCSTARWINNMVDQAREVTYETLVRRVGVDQLASVFPFYEWGRGTRAGLRMKDDYMISYYRSKYRGRTCYYVCHSSIEYIFTESG